MDIRGSTHYFKDNASEKIARVMRAFCSEIISILKANTNYRQIGIRGDCVYAIYSVSTKNDISSVFDDACCINTFQKMFQRILKQNHFPTFKIGIGLGVQEDLVIKAGKKGTGINDYIWIGDAVIDASKLSNQGNKDGFCSIVMDYCFWNNISGFETSDKKKYGNCIPCRFSKILGTNVYHCDMIMTEFNDWIEENV